jgi:hypothetical protein
VTELRQALGVREGMVRLSPVARPPLPPSGGNGRGEGGSGSNGNGHLPENGSGDIP